MSKKRRSIHSKRKTKSLHHSFTYPPMRNFANNEAKPILAEIKSRKVNDIIRKSLINYLVIRSVTIFEHYFINEAQKLGERVKQEDLDKLLDNIIPDKPKGEQLASSFNYANLNHINHVFSTLLNMDFLNEIKHDSEINYRDYYYEDVHIPWATPLHKNWNNFLMAFDLRDDIVHHNKNANLSYSQIRNLVESVLDFTISSSVTIE